MNSFSRIYWQIRGKKSYGYKGNQYYTITPISYYYQRRKVLISQINTILEQYSICKKRILYFDYGDGWYVKYFASSQAMIQRARLSMAGNCSALCSTEVFKNENSQFDQVDAIAVLAIFWMRGI